MKTSKGNIKTSFGLPVYSTEEYDYILEKDIPEKYKEEFSNWMRGQTCGLVDGVLAIYVWDWDRWHNMKVHDIPTYFD